MQMNVRLKETLGDWALIKNLCNTTVNKDVEVQKDAYISSEFKTKLLRAEHSPIRAISFVIELEIPTFVSTHLVRHKHGIEHFVATQRSDRTNTPRDERKQTDMVKHTIIANQQAILNISRKRLCTKASADTRVAWQLVLSCLQDANPELVSLCVPECIARGFCPEIRQKNELCKVDNIEGFTKALKHYRKG